MNRIALLAVLAAVVVASEPIAPGVKAPAFTLPNTSGAEIALSSFAGKTVVLEWVNYDCPFVKKHYVQGHMSALQKRYADQGVVWLSICTSAPGKQGHFAGQALLDRVAAEKAVPTHYLIDDKGVVGKQYGAVTTPQMAVIDAEGMLRYHGAIDSIRSTKAEDIPKATNHLVEALDAVLAGQPVAVPTTKPYGCSVKY